jgi:glycosyltransferase involved in cell wall biosynthesis
MATGSPATTTARRGGAAIPRRARTVSRTRRRQPTRLDLRAYRVMAAAARWLLRLRPPAHGQEPQRTKVTILLMHAWGMGGTIRATLNVAGHLAPRHDVEVLSVLRRRDEPFFTFPPGVSVTALDDQRAAPRALPGRVLQRFRGRLLHPDDGVVWETTLWTDLQVLRALWRVRRGVLMGTRPALNLLATEAVRRGLAVVAIEHTTWRAYQQPLRQGIRRRYPKIDAVVVLSKRERRRFARALQRRTRVLAIPNAVAQPTGPPAPLERPVVLGVGRLERVKGFDRLIGAFAQVVREHPEWSLRICGSGTEHEALQAQIDEHGLGGHVELAGRVTDIEREMEQASLFVLSSRAEGFPLAMLEAMAKGLPVVSFNCPSGPRNIIRNGVDGLLVPNRDIDGLARAMILLIADEAQRHRLAAAGRQKAWRYGMETVGGRWEKLIAELTV